MQLSGVASRLVQYRYYTAALADGTSYTVTVNGHIGVMGQAIPAADAQLQLSGDGSNWNTASTINAVISIPTYASCVKIKNSSGGAVPIHIVGWYIS